jgi:BolA family transcriptional regulator, general stress-responsive regulator
MSTIVEQLKTMLTDALDATAVVIEDDSWQHAGHGGAPQQTEATHLTITVVSPRFEGVSLIDQHRMVNDLLTEARATHLHALQLKTLTPQQAVSVQ